MAAKRDTSALGPFADDLRAYREQAGLSREELGAQINYSASLIAMVETRGRAPTRKLALLCDKTFGTPGTFERHKKRLRDVPFSSGFRPFEPYEEVAVSLRLFEHTLIPGLLQTEDYARAVLSTHPGTTPDEMDERLVARMARQAILDREDPPRPSCGSCWMSRYCTATRVRGRSCTNSSCTWRTWPGGRTSPGRSSQRL